MTKLKRYGVVLKNGADYSVMAKSKADAIKRVKAGKGRKIGQYIECSPTKRDQAFLED